MNAVSNHIWHFHHLAECCWHDVGARLISLPALVVCVPFTCPYTQPAMFIDAIITTRTVLTRTVSSYGLPAALSDYGVNAAGIAEIIVIFRNDSSLAEMPGSFA